MRPLVIVITSELQSKLLLEKLYKGKITTENNAKQRVTVQNTAHPNLKTFAFISLDVSRCVLTQLFSNNK